MRVFPGGDGNFETGMKKVRAAIAKDPLIGVHLKVATVHTIRSRIKGLTGKEKTELVSRRFEVAREARAPAPESVRALRARVDERSQDRPTRGRSSAVELRAATSRSATSGTSGISFARPNTIWLQQLLGDVDISTQLIPGPAHCQVRHPTLPWWDSRRVGTKAYAGPPTPWLAGTPLDQATTVYEQSGYYSTFSTNGFSVTSCDLRPDNVAGSVTSGPKPIGNATLNKTNLYANVSAGDGHLSIDVNDTLGSTDVGLIWFFDDVLRPVLLPLSPATGGEPGADWVGAFDAVARSPRSSERDAALGQLILNFFSTGRMNDVFAHYEVNMPAPRPGHNQQSAQAPNWLPNPNDPASAHNSPKSPTFTLLQTLVSPGPTQGPGPGGRPSYWPPGDQYYYPPGAADGSTSVPDQVSSYWKSILPGCQSIRSGVYANKILSVLARINVFPAPGVPCDAAGNANAICVRATFDPLGANSSGYPGFVVEDVLDYANGTAVSPTNGNFIETSCVYDGTHIYVFGVSGNPGTSGSGLQPTPGVWVLRALPDWSDPRYFDGAAWSPWTAGMALGADQVLSGFDSVKVIQLSVARLEVPHFGPLWVMLYALDGDESIYVASASEPQGAWSLEATAVASTPDYYGTIIQPPPQPMLRHHLLGPKTFAGVAKDAGHLYMPKILAGYSQTATAQLSRKTGAPAVVLYWTVSTLLPYYPHLMMTTFSP